MSHGVLSPLGRAAVFPTLDGWPASARLADGLSRAGRTLIPFSRSPTDGSPGEHVRRYQSDPPQTGLRGLLWGLP